MRRCALIALLIVAAMLAVAAAPAAAAPPTSTTAGQGTLALGGGSPQCATPGRLSTTAQRACKGSGTVESPYPVGNYGLDVHIDTGATKIANDFDSAVASVVALVFAMLAKLVRWMMLALELAFSFDLFGRDPSGQIPHGLQTAQRLFTSPLLPLAFVIAGGWGVWEMFKHRAGRMLGGYVAMIAMVLLGLVLVTDPAGTLGPLDRFSNQAGTASIAVFSSHDPSRPTAGFADALGDTFTTVVQRPWCAMEFGTVDWCAGPIDKQMHAARRETLAHWQTHPPHDRQAAALFKAATTNGGLFLAFPPGNDERNGKNDSWTLYHHLLTDQPAAAVERTSSGLGDRFGTLVVVGIGVLVALLLFGYVAVNLLLAAVFFVMLLALTPVMMLAPCFGDTGRQVFRRWLGHLLGALFAKLIYGIYLGATIFTSSVVLALGASTGWFGQWVVLAVFWWLAFAYRTRILGYVTGGHHHEHHHGLQALGTLWMVRRAAHQGREIVEHGRRTVGGAAVAGNRRLVAGREAQLERAQRERLNGQRVAADTAERELQTRATQRVESRYQEAQQTVQHAPEIEAQVRRYRQGAEQRRQRREQYAARAGVPVAPAGARERQLAARAHELQTRLASDRRLVSTVQESERATGRRFSAQQVRDAREQMRQEAQQRTRERDYGRLAYRINKSPAEYQRAPTREQLRMRQQIDRTIRHERLLHAAADLAPDRSRPQSHPAPATRPSSRERPPVSKRARSGPLLPASAAPTRPQTKDARTGALVDRQPATTPVDGVVVSPTAAPAQRARPRFPHPPTRRHTRGGFPGARDHVRPRRRDR